MQVDGDRTCVYSELPAIKHFLHVTSPDPEQVDARRLRIDYINQAASIVADARVLEEAAVRNRAGLRRPAQAAAVAAGLGQCDFLR